MDFARRRESPCSKGHGHLNKNAGQIMPPRIEKVMTKAVPVEKRAEKSLDTYFVGDLSTKR